MEGRKT